MEDRRTLLNRQHVLVKILVVVACLYLFLVGIGAMSSAFRIMGESGATQMIVTSGPLVSLFIGILATTLVQSSSTTTATVVALVAAGQLSLESGIFMVMGANVGTTVTNTVVSLGHITRSNEFKRAFAAATVHDFFNVIALVILFPLELYTGFLTHMSDWAVGTFESVGGGSFASPLKAVTQPTIGLLKWLCMENGVALLVVGILLMFTMLIGLVKSLKAMAIHRIENLFDRVIFRTPGRALVFGIALTILVQSSSVTTSLAVPLVGAGLLTIRQVFPYTMGANIGTTCTACIAALGALAAATPESRDMAILGLSVAFHHVFFNVLGVAILWWVREIPIKIAEGFASLAMANKWIPIVYIILTFYLLPIIVIWLGS